MLNRREKKKKKEKYTSSEFCIDEDTNVSAMWNGIIEKEETSKSSEKREDIEMEKKVPKRVLIRANKINVVEDKKENENSRKHTENMFHANEDVYARSDFALRNESVIYSFEKEKSYGKREETTEERELKNQRDKREIFIFGRDEKAREEIKKMFMNKMMKEEYVSESRNNSTSDLGKNNGFIRVLQKEHVKRNEKYMAQNGKIITTSTKKKEKGGSLFCYKEKDKKMEAGSFS